MSDVQFDNDFNINSTPQFAGGGMPGQSKGMEGWLIRKGIAKSEGAAKAILLGIAVVNIVIIILVISFLF